MDANRVARVIRSSEQNESNAPVTTARYRVEIVMNEEYPDADRTNTEHIEAFDAEFQRALDDGYFGVVRGRSDLG